MLVFKKEWKDYMKENVNFNSYRMNYCTYSKSQEGINFWAGSYVCYGKSKKGYYDKVEKRQLGELYFMGLTSEKKSIVNHFQIENEKLAKRIVNRIKKHPLYGFVYEVIKTTSPIKIRDNLYVFKVDIHQPKWKVQAALFANRGIARMSEQEMKWALSLNDDDLMKWLLCSYSRRSPDNTTIWHNDDNAILGDNIDEGFKLFKRLLEGERIVHRKSKKEFDNLFSEDGQWEFRDYIMTWLKKEGKRTSNTCTIGNRTFSVRSW